MVSISSLLVASLPYLAHLAPLGAFAVRTQCVFLLDIREHHLKHLTEISVYAMIRGTGLEISRVHSPSWSFDLRSHHYDSSDTDDDSPHIPYPNTSEDARLAKELDLSSRPEEVEFKSNPWSIAKVNATLRRKGSTQPAHRSPKINASRKTKPIGALASAFETQAKRKNPNSGLPLLKLQTSTPLGDPHRGQRQRLVQSQNRPTSGDTTLNFPRSLPTCPPSHQAPASAKLETSLTSVPSGYMRVEPSLNAVRVSTDSDPQIPDSLCSSSFHSRVEALPINSVMSTGASGVEGETLPSSPTSLSINVDESRDDTLRCFIHSSQDRIERLANPTGVIRPIRDPAQVFRGQQRVNTSDLNVDQFVDKSLGRAPTVQSVMCHQRPPAHSPHSSPGPLSSSVNHTPRGALLREVASSPIPYSIKIHNSSSYPSSQPGPTRFRHRKPALPPLIAGLVSQDPPSHERQLKFGDRKTTSEALPRCTDQPDKPDNTLTMTEIPPGRETPPLALGKRCAYTVLTSPPDTSWSTFPTSKKPRSSIIPRTNGSTSIKKSGPFKLSIPVAKQRSTQNLQGLAPKVRVTTYLPPPPPSKPVQTTKPSINRSSEGKIPRVNIVGRAIPLLRVSQPSPVYEPETKTTQPDQDCLSSPRFSRHCPANDDEGTLYVPFGITDVQGRLASVSRSIDQRHNTGAQIWDLLGLPSCGVVFRSSRSQKVVGDEREFEIPIVFWEGSCTSTR